MYKMANIKRGLLQTKQAIKLLVLNREQIAEGKIISINFHRLKHSAFRNDTNCFFTLNIVLYFLGLIVIYLY